MFIQKIVRFFVSLRLTVTLLAFAIILVFVGTIAQADEGLYGAQAHYFKQWIVIGAHMFGHEIPIILPGGYLIGTLLLINLVTTHIYRFEFTLKKTGIQIAHAGIIVILVGQLSTDLVSREMQMHFAEGETLNYANSATDFELVFLSGNEATSIPEKLLKPGNELKINTLPFTIAVKAHWHNSDVNFRAPMMQNGPPLSTNGIAAHFDFRQVANVKEVDQQNIPTAILEFKTPQGSLGTWVASDWAGDASLAEALRNSYARQLGAGMAQGIAQQLVAPQTIDVEGKAYSFTMRPTRVHFPFSFTLLKATHTTYPGTDIPKDFRSRVLLNNPGTGEKREIDIYMNHPLRYGGYTYYQYQMDAGQMTREAGRAPTSVLSVVRNPSWLTPYIGCVMVAIGLVIQFMYHLVGFVSKRKKK
jgi:hypothetical protein